MQGLPMRVMSAERGVPQVDGGRRLVAPLATTAGLGLLVGVLCDWAFARHFTPPWPMVLAAVALFAGLVADRLAQRIGARSAPASTQSVLTFAALLLLGFGSADPHPVALLLRLVAVLLAVGLLSGPLGTRVLSGRPVQEAALPLAGLTALLVFIWALAADGYGSMTVSGSTYILDDLHTGTVRLVFLLLSVVLVAAAVRGPATVRRLLGLAAAGTALTVLLVALTSSPSYLFFPQYPYEWAAGALSFGLVVELLTRLVGLPSAELLADRVNELSRTRSGALDVQATELRRIERDLHDGAQVRLIALTMKLGRAEARYRDDPETQALLREAREDATAAIRELRELARGIAPAVLANRGLEAAVRSLAQRSGVEVVVSGTLTRRLLPAIETAAYFVVAESLANVAKHAPSARVEIGLRERGGHLFIEVTDFGPGGADPAGNGLTGLRQRVEALDGVLHVTSPAGVGTQVEAVLPCGR